MAGKVFVDLIFDINNKVKLAVDGLKKDLDKAKVHAKKFNDDLNKSFDSIKTGAGIAAAGITAVSAGLIALGTKAAAAYNVQEDAVKRLNTALKSSNSFTQEASKDMQKFAASMEETTRHGDEVILNQLALAKSFGASNKQAKLIVKTAADLAAEMGIDLESAVRNVSKTLGGFAGELGETIPELKTLGKETLMSGEGVALLSKRFDGAAKESVKTFSGSLDQLNNTFGSVFEEIGKNITQNKAMKAVISTLNDTFKQTILFLAQNEDALLNLANIGVSAFLSGIEAASSVLILFNRALGGARIVIRSVIQGFLNLGSMISGFASMIPGVGDKFKELNETMNLWASDFEKNTEKGVEIQALFEDKVKSVTETFVTEVGKRTKAAEEAAVKQAKAFNKAVAPIVGAGGGPPIVGGGAMTATDTPVLLPPIVGGGAMTATDTPVLLDKKPLLVKIAGPTPQESMAAGVGGLLSGGNVGDIIGDAAGAAASMIPVIGPALGKVVGPLVKLMGKSAKEMRETFKNISTGIVTFVKNFITNIPVLFEEILKFGPQLFSAIVNAIPGIIESFAENIPAVIEAAVMQLPTIFNAIVQGIPRIVSAIIRAIPRLVVTIIRQIPKLITSFINSFVKGLPQLFEEIIESIPTIIDGFISAIPEVIAALIESVPSIITGVIGGLPRIITGFVKSIPRIIGEVVGSIPQIISRMVQAIPGMAGAFVGALIDRIPIIGGGGVGGILSSIPVIGGFFAEGGYVPKGFPNDSFPARLTSGEFVVNNNLTPKLERFLDGRNAGGNDLVLNQILDIVSRPMVVQSNVEFRQETLAKIILELNRSNARLA